jgi:MSHA biogenesis protein MshN
LRENAASLDTEFNDDETELSLNEENINEKSEAWYDEHLNQALEAIQEGEDPRAIDLLTGILQKFPASVEARENLAALYFSHGTLSKASDVVEEGLAFEPNNLRLSLLQARVYVEQSQPQKALKTLEQFKPTIQKVPEYYALLAAVFEALGRTDEAGTVYQNLIQIDPNNGQYWLGLGVALENKRSFQQAIEAFRRAAQSDNLQLSARNYAENRISNLQG